MKKTLLISSSLMCLLLLSLLLVSCGDNGGGGQSNATPTPASTPTQASAAGSTPTSSTQATPTTSAAPVNFVAFSNGSFSLYYPHDWTQKQNGNNYSFARSDVVTQFVVGLHNKDQNPQTVINNLTNSVMSCTQNTQVASSVTPNSLTWQQSSWNCYLANATYIVYILSHVNSQTNDKTVIAYGDYQQVASSSLIPFDQANTQYFQPMLKSFQLK